jgi:hypothetical protein
MRIVTAASLAVAIDWLIRWAGRTAPSLSLVSLQQIRGAHSYHGEPAVNMVGVCFVLFMLAVQAGVVQFALAGKPRLGSRDRWLKAMAVVFGASCGFVLIFDPRFLPTALPRSMWDGYRSTLETVLPAALSLYEGWAYSRWFIWFAVAHAALLAAVAVAMLWFVRTEICRDALERRVSSVAERCPPSS